MRKLLHFIHSINGGYVDTIGFVALYGLMAAHVTGNIVTLSASIALGLHANLAKILALPTFFVAVIVIRGLTYPLHERSELRHMHALLAISTVLLAVVAGLYAVFGPFADADHPVAVVTAVVAVVAMAAQNILQRLHLPRMTPTTMMTGTITSLMMDLADLAHRRRRHAAAAEVAGRVWMTLRALSGFVVGGATAAAAYMVLGRWCFVPAVALSAAAAAVTILVTDETS